MLDDRLIGTTFALPTKDRGTVTLYGIHYHYRVSGEAAVGSLVVVVEATPLELKVRAVTATLDY